MEPGFEAIRTEINVKLGQGQNAPAVKSDVAAVAGDEPSLAQRLDEQKYPGLPPVTSYVARTIFWHTLAYGDSAKGITAEQLKLSVCSPALEPAFIEQARIQFVADSIYLDDRPGLSLRFMVEPNLTMIVRRVMRDIDAVEVRTEFAERIRQLFSLPRGEFNAILSPSGRYEVPDEVGDGRPLLVVLNHDSTTVPADNLVFVAADERTVPNMRDLVHRRMALDVLQKPEHQRELADYQHGKVKAEFEVREARNLTQEHLASILHKDQSAISQMERRSDIYARTLAGFIKALGGELEIRANFPDGSVRITGLGDHDRSA